MVQAIDLNNRKSIHLQKNRVSMVFVIVIGAVQGMRGSKGAEDKKKTRNITRGRGV